MNTYFKKHKTVYYNDELKDDFGRKTPREELGEFYKYERKGFYKFISNCFFYLIAYPLASIGRLFKGVKVIGKENLKELKKKKEGFFIFANHNGEFPIVMAELLSAPIRCNIVGYSDAYAQLPARPFLRILGYLPLPNSLIYYKKFKNALKFYIKDQKQSILIFPESTFWPYKIGVRKFVNTSFKYPAELNAPILPIYFGYRKRKGILKLFGKKPVLTVSIGKAIYPKEGLSLKENANYLGDTTYETLTNLSNNMDQEIYVDYVKKEFEEERKKLTICVVCDVYGEENNGTIAVENDLINFLRSQGHTVRILCCDQNQYGKENYYVCPKRNFFIFNKYVEKNGVELGKPDKKIIKAAIDGCDAIHVMMPLSLGSAAAKYAYSKKITITAGFHTQSENVLSHLFLKDVKFANKLLYKSFYRKLYRYVDTVHYPSEFIRQVFEKISKLGNGVVISNAIKSGFKKIDGIEKPKELKDKFVICYAGRFSKEKKQIFLIKALKKIKHLDNVHLILAGKGPTLKKLQRLTEKLNLDKHITFVYIPHEELPKMLNYCDLFVSTSQIDIQAVSTLEAISCGVTPIFNDSKRSSGRFFALDSRNTFKDKNTKDLARKIDYWYENPEERKKCSEEYLKLVDQFDYHNCMQQMEEMIYFSIKNKKRLLDMDEIR